MGGYSTTTWLTTPHRSAQPSAGRKFQGFKFLDNMHCVERFTSWVCQCVYGLIFIDYIIRVSLEIFVCIFFKYYLWIMYMSSRKTHNSSKCNVYSEHHCVYTIDVRCRHYLYEKCVASDRHI